MDNQNSDAGERAKFFRWGSWAMLLLAIFLGVQTLGAFKGLRNNPAENTISVMGEGEVMAVPDVATFYFTVSADAADVNTAQANVNTKMEAILAELEKLGVEEKDIKTTDYSVWPKYRFETDRASMPCTPYSCPPSGNQVPDGYTASHNVHVKVRKTDEAGKILGAVGTKGATNISSISFTIDDPEKLYEEARSEAIADAKAKAKALSRELNVRLTRIVSYNDSQGGYPYPVPYMMEARGAADSAVKAVAPALPQGENSIKVTVNVVYEIR